MEWLTQNVVADMYGPQFLILYAAVIIVSAIVCRVASRRLDWTRSAGLPVIPSSPDPFEIAYLRGGENELLRSLVFGLIQRGYLRVSADAKMPLIERTELKPEARALPPLERRAYEWFAVPREAKELFTAGGLRGQVGAFAATYEQRLTGEHLLTPPDVRAAAFRVWCLGAAFVVGLGGYKLLVAVEKGRYNVGFLVVMGVVGLVVLGVACRVPRLSQKGKAYLERLQLAFERLKAQAVSRPANTLSITPTAAGASAAAGAADPTLLLAVGLFGVGTLAGTAYDDYQRTFQKSAASSSSGGSCGGSSSSCGSSGGDGGGGGCSGGSGCGGGGCGGCGGS